MALLCLQLVVSGFKYNKNTIHNQSETDFNQKVILFEDSQIRVESNFVEYQEPNRSVIKNYLILSFVNKTREKLSINFSKELYYNNTCSSCGFAESNFSVILNKREIKTGTCEIGSDKALKVFHSFKTGESERKLTDFRITNVSIKKA